MSPELIEYIEQFLEGEISKEVLETYAKEAHVEELEEKINWVKQTRIAVEAEGLKDQLSDLFGQQKSKETKIRKLGFSKFTWAAAASILVLIGGYWLINGTNNQNDLFAQFEYKDAGLPVVMGQSSNYQFDDAMTYFVEENYKQAEAKFSAIQNPSDTVNYFLGASQFYVGKSKLAEAKLQEVANYSSSSFKEKATWLLVLNALKSNDIEKSKRFLSVITNNSNHSFFKEAKALESQINQ